MAKITLICGTLCSGKTTLAQKICAQTGAVQLSCDELMLALFPDDGLGADYEIYAARAKEYLLRKAEALYKSGMNVVLDWGFWTRAERETIAGRFAGQAISVEWVRINITESTWQRYIESRNRSVNSGLAADYPVDEELRSKAIKLFEPMTDDELKLYATFS